MVLSRLDDGTESCVKYCAESYDCFLYVNWEQVFSLYTYTYKAYLVYFCTYILYSLPSYLYKFMHHIVIDNIREVYIRRNSFSASPKLKVKK